MNPIFLDFGSYQIHWYGVMAALGFLAANYLVQRNCRYANLTKDQGTTLVFIGVLSGVIGARIFYVLLNFHEYKDNLLSIFAIYKGGLVFYGGFILALLSLLIYCKLKKLSVLAVFDVLAPALALGHAFGRIGCFLNGCCYGKPAPKWLGVIYPQSNNPNSPYCVYGDTPLHAVQLYECFFNLILCFILYKIVRKGKRGMAMSTYIFMYGVLRFVDEFSRGDHPARELCMGLSPAQLIGLAIVPIGLLLMGYFWKHGTIQKIEVNPEK